MAFTSLEINGSEARVCFTRIGAREPCLRILVAQDDAVLEATADGGLAVRTVGLGNLDLLVTALTASGASVGLGTLDPVQLVSEYRIGAALLVATDPSYPYRRDRLEALGFQVAHTSGPYEVLVRTDLLPGSARR